MVVYRQPYCRGALIFVTLLLITAAFPVNSQNITDAYFYRIYLKDKGENNINSTSLSNLVSPKAIARRNKIGIRDADSRDLPVWSGYLNQISSTGLTLHCTSKWMNTALFRSAYLIDIQTILDLPFVNNIIVVKKPGVKSSFLNKLDFQENVDDFAAYDRPITMVNGYPLHNSGFTGKNVLIAVLDGGFSNSDLIQSLSHLRNRNGIKYTFDFVNNTGFVYNSSTHGTAVLSILAGKADENLAGTATGADYLLLKTEDVVSEFPCEEDYWVAGAELADSLGADIISSSLGYYNFDDASMNYKYSDLDGNTAFITKAADIAASKGILVVSSAGNERNKDWKRILFPADGDSVLASAAVQSDNLISAFSSAGPASDGRIKPDIATMGVGVPLQTSPTSVTRGNGTSFSCPVLSGMAACLIQAVPEAGNFDIIEALIASSDRQNSPDSLYGYGIPDIVTALIELQDRFIKIPDDIPLAYPNPSTGDFEIIFKEQTNNIIIEIFSMTGTLIYRKIYPEFIGRRISITELQNYDQGIYMVRVVTNESTNVLKVIKINY